MLLEYMNHFSVSPLEDLKTVYMWWSRGGSVFSLMSSFGARSDRPGGGSELL